MSGKGNVEGSNVDASGSHVDQSVSDETKWGIGAAIFIVLVLIVLYVVFVYNNPENKALRAIAQATLDCNAAVASGADADYVKASISIAEANKLYDLAVASYAGAPISVALSNAGLTLTSLTCQYQAILASAASGVDTFSTEWDKTIADRKAAAASLQDAMQKSLDKDGKVDKKLLDAADKLNKMFAVSSDLKPPTAASKDAKKAGFTGGDFRTLMTKARFAM